MGRKQSDAHATPERVRSASRAARSASTRSGNTTTPVSPPREIPSSRATLFESARFTTGLPALRTGFGGRSARPRPQGARHNAVRWLPPASRRPWARSVRDGSPHPATMTPPAWKAGCGRSCSYDHPQDDVGAAVLRVLKEVPLLCSPCGFAAADDDSHPAIVLVVVGAAASFQLADSVVR